MTREWKERMGDIDSNQEFCLKDWMRSGKMKGFGSDFSVVCSLAKQMAAVKEMSRTVYEAFL